jgi:predicted membrane protein
MNSCGGRSIPVSGFLLLSWLSLFRLSNTLVRIFAPLVSVMILLQVLLMRWNVVIGGQLMSKSERGAVFFHPEWFDKEGILPALVIMVLPLAILFLLSKIFPFWQEDDPAVLTQTAEK